MDQKRKKTQLNWSVEKNLNQTFYETGTLREILDLVL